ncbi:MAG TPA: cytochrome c biogenesis protein CcdA [Chitinophagaceae bacterium]|nr:cytochrome c biogenesis protein CcdA [Chitinophagaceae bacterium]
MKHFIFLLLLFFTVGVYSQNTGQVTWQFSSKKNADKEYEINGKGNIKDTWHLYGPNNDIEGLEQLRFSFTDSSIVQLGSIEVKGSSKKINDALLGTTAEVYEGGVELSLKIKFTGDVPAKLKATLLYNIAGGEEFIPVTDEKVEVEMEGGVASNTRIKIQSIDIKNPVATCGDDDTEGKSLASIFFLGLIGGFIALLTPCVFPLIPLTVSFFTKRSTERKKGAANAMLYGFFIFLIYVLLSLPFHLLDQANPEILNNISTNIWLNLLFFIIFIVFAISFFGYFEIGLPPSLASKIDSRSGIGNWGGIFFMALTLAIVSFSCTGPILGSLLAGALTNNGGAIQLTFGMGGFGLGLALPFALFALFPQWLHSLPKSGGWLTSVKVVLGFLELAMAIKFLSNADLVAQWGFLKREIFIGSWIVIGIAIILYLVGFIRFPHDSPVKKIKGIRLAFIILFSITTLYITPGITNTKWANLKLISGFPPPLCYSLYTHPVNCEKGIEPLRDYEEALRIAKAENKPILIDFTGWACVNCRRMEEKVWVDPDVVAKMKNDFVVVSLYVDEKQVLPAAKQLEYKTKTGADKSIVTVGDKWATFQSENFNAVSQPQYAIISTDEKALTKTKGYTPNSSEFNKWLQCGLDAFKSSVK